MRFFAAARRGMYALLTGDLTAASGRARGAWLRATEAGEADTYAIERTLAAGIARQAGDTATLAGRPRAVRGVRRREGVTSVAAEAAVLWVAAG